MTARKADEQPQLVPPALARSFPEVIAGLEVAAIDAVEEARRARGAHAAALLGAEGGWLRRIIRRLVG